MVFSSPVFLFAFLPFVLLFYYLVPARYKNLLLFVCSLFFYAWGELHYVVILILSIIINYVFGLYIARVSDIRILITGVMFNLLILMYFKYSGFILINLGIDDSKIPDLALPLGISFFTFQAMSYLIDIHRKESLPQKSFINLGLYISFFPQLIAGPIVRYHDIAKKLIRRNHSVELFVSGIERFSYGLAKKIIIANAMAEVADSILKLPLTQVSQELAWLAIICYALQIYFDFSAYSDMAIGLGRMFGFKFQENFNYPYIANSLTDFWRRWHISLSRWFRDYLYIPLGGNRKGKIRTYFNLFIVFVLCGFWHGASWNFLVWGLIHGFLLVAERAGLSNILIRFPSIVRHIYTLLAVLVAWVFFRIENLTDALEYIGLMFAGSDSANALYSYHYFVSNQFIIISLFALVLITPVWKRFVTYYPASVFSGTTAVQSVRAVSISLLLLASLIQVSASTYNPFIYFRF